MPSPPFFTRLLRARVPRELTSPHDWQRRAATLTAAILIGVVALGFARAGDWAQARFLRLQADYAWANLVVTPAVFLAIALITRRFAEALKAP